MQIYHQKRPERTVSESKCSKTVLLSFLKIKNLIGIKVELAVTSGCTAALKRLKGSLSLFAPFLVNGAVCVKDHKGFNVEKLSKQLSICSQWRHEVTPVAQLPFLFLWRT